MDTKKILETEVVKFADDDLVNLTELAQALRQSRWTIRRWMRLEDNPYEFQYGTCTTPGHCKAWMEANRDRFKRKAPTPEWLERQEVVLAKIRGERTKKVAARHTVNKVGGGV